MKRGTCMMIQGTISFILAFLSDRLGILFPVLCVLMGAMIIDYLTGMLASKKESLEHPNDKNYGWSSKTGALGIIKKVSYLCVIAVAMMVDYIITVISTYLSISMPFTVFFGLLVAVWYLLNELLSIIENAGRMGGPIPEWLRTYIAVLKDKIDNQDYDKEETHDQ